MNELEKEGLSADNAAQQVIKEMIQQDKSMQVLEPQVSQMMYQGSIIKTLKAENNRLRKEIASLRHEMQKLDPSMNHSSSGWFRNLVLPFVRKYVA